MAERKDILRLPTNGVWDRMKFRPQQNDHVGPSLQGIGAYQNRGVQLFVNASLIVVGVFFALCILITLGDPSAFSAKRQTIIPGLIQTTLISGVISLVALLPTLVTIVLFYGANDRITINLDDTVCRIEKRYWFFTLRTVDIFLRDLRIDIAHSHQQAIVSRSDGWGAFLLPLGLVGAIASALRPGQKRVFEGREILFFDNDELRVRLRSTNAGSVDRFLRETKKYDVTSTGAGAS